MDHIDPRQIADMAPVWMEHVLKCDEGELERLPFRQRDEIISWGLARRLSNRLSGDGRWHTWITPLGMAVRDVLVERREALLEPVKYRPEP
jgi:hypothetical protein